MLPRVVPPLLLPGWSPHDPQVTLDTSTTGLVFGGTWLTSSPDKYAWGGGGTNVSGIDFAATGTRLDVPLYANVANNWTVTVDGVSVNPPVPSGAYTTVTLFQGPHKTRQVALRCSSGHVKLSGFGTLWGRRPSVGYATGLGPNYAVKDDINSVDNRSFIRHDDSLKLVTVAGGYDSFPGLNGAGTCGYLRFKATTAAVAVWCQQSGQSLRLVVDGVTQAAGVTEASGGRWDWIVWSGLDGSAEHEYRVVLDSHEPASLFAWQVAVSGTLNTGALAAPPKLVAFYGDSITAGTGVTYPSLGYAHQTMLGLGYGGRVAGLDGRSVRNYGAGGSSPGGGESGEADVARSLTAYGTAYDSILVLLGTNDAGAIYGAFNAANVQASYSTMLTALRTAYPSAKIRCLGMLPVASSATNYYANRTATNTAISNAVTAAADAGITYHSTDGVIDPTTDTGDGIHPNAAGVAKVVTFASGVLP